jgi:hypothetical protein
MISFTHKTKSIYFNYFLGDLLIVRTGCVIEVGVMLDSKLHFDHHVYLQSQALNLIEPVRFIIYDFLL